MNRLNNVRQHSILTFIYLSLRQHQLFDMIQIRGQVFSLRMIYKSYKNALYEYTDGIAVPYTYGSAVLNLKWYVNLQMYLDYTSYY